MAKIRFPDYDEIIDRHSSKYGVDPDLIRAIIQQESQGNPKAKSKRGALGLMQLMPGMALKWYHLTPEDLEDPEKNIKAGVSHFSDMLKYYKGDKTKAIAAYNAGQGPVDKANGVPNIDETKGYVKNVSGYYAGTLDPPKAKLKPVAQKKASMPPPPQNAKAAQSGDIDQETIAKYLESPDFVRLPPAKKQQAVDYLKTRMQRSVGQAPNTGEQSLKRFQSADPQAAAMQGYAGRVEDEETPPGNVSEQLLVGGGRAVKGMLQDTPSALANPKKLPEFVVGPHIETAKKSKEAFKQGRTSEGLGYAGATALPFVGPYAAHLGELVAKGRPYEALGEASVFWLADRLAKGTQRETTRSQRLSAATGALPEHFDVLAGEMAETSKKSGTPKKIGELADNLKETNNRVTSRFSVLLQPLRGRQRLPQEVATKLLQKAQEYDVHTPEGRATRNYLRRRAADYMKPWTLGELDTKRRQLFNARLEAKSPAGQTVAMKASDEILADKIIEDGLKDIVYGDVEAANPKVDVRSIKEKESRLIEVREQLKKQIDDLTQSQAEYQASPLSKRLGMSMSGHVGGITPRVHGLLPGSGPLDIANKQVKRGFPSRGNKLRDLGTKLRVNTIKNYPITALYSQSQQTEKKSGEGADYHQVKGNQKSNSNEPEDISDEESRARKDIVNLPNNPKEIDAKMEKSLPPFLRGLRAKITKTGDKEMADMFVARTGTKPGDKTIMVDSPDMFDTGTLAHEMTHVFQNTRNVKYANPEYDYDYGKSEGLRKAIKDRKTIASFSPEQQAAIVEDYYRMNVAVISLAKKQGNVIYKDQAKWYEDQKGVYEPFMKQLVNLPSRDSRERYSMPKPPVPSIPSSDKTGFLELSPTVAGILPYIPVRDRPAK